MTLIRIQRKPTTLEAIQWTGGNWERVRQFAGPTVRRLSDTVLVLDESPAPPTPINQGDYLVRQPGGRLLRVAESDLDLHYNRVD